MVEVLGPIVPITAEGELPAPFSKLHLTELRPSMTDSCSLRWCPQCRMATQHGVLPQLANDQAHLMPLSSQDDVEVFRRQLYCLSCRAIWEAVELPSATLRQLVAVRDELEDVRRQLAMLRLLAAQQRQSPEQAQRPALRLAG